MIELGSLVGFAVAFLAIAIGCSSAAGFLWLALRRRIASFGPAAERASAAVVLVFPPLIAAATILMLIVRSYLSTGALDHCPVHVHHAHLCVYHGGIWASTTWAVLLSTVCAVVLGAKLGEAIARAARARSDLARLRGASTSSRRQDGVEILRVDSTRVFCFTAGLIEPRVYLSSSAMSRWSNDEQRAAIAHELGHARHRDLSIRMLLGLCAAFGAPLITRRLFETWSAATERLRDEDAARSVGDPSIVASALVTLARAGIGEPAAHAMSIASGDLEARIEALLAFEPAARRLHPGGIYGAAGAALACCFAATILRADQVHHFLETIFGAI